MTSFNEDLFVKERFLGSENRRLRVEVLMSQKLLCGNADIVEELCDSVEISDVKKGEVLIEQNGMDNDIYLVISGKFSIVVNGKVVAERFSNDHVGEMAAIEPSHRRSASVIASEDSVVAKLTEPQFNKLAERYSSIYKYLAKEVSRRLLQRNSLVKSGHDKIRVFIICSVEALDVARTIQSNFSHEDFLTVIWSDGVFKVTNYTLQTLEDEVEKSDFAIAIAHGDDQTDFRGKTWPSPRDNVIFELGLFMGRLGRHRAILMEPRSEKVKLPSDLSGIATITYKYESGNDARTLMGPACNELREHILRYGPNN